MIEFLNLLKYHINIRCTVECRSHTRRRPANTLVEIRHTSIKLPTDARRVAAAAGGTPDAPICHGSRDDTDHDSSCDATARFSNKHVVLNHLINLRFV